MGFITFINLAVCTDLFMPLISLSTCYCAARAKHCPTSENTSVEPVHKMPPTQVWGMEALTECLASCLVSNSALRFQWNHSSAENHQPSHTLSHTRPAFAMHMRRLLRRDVFHTRITLYVSKSWSLTWLPALTEFPSGTFNSIIYHFAAAWECTGKSSSSKPIDSPSCGCWTFTAAGFGRRRRTDTGQISYSITFPRWSHYGCGLLRGVPGSSIAKIGVVH